MKKSELKAIIRECLEETARQHRKSSEKHYQDYGSDPLQTPLKNRTKFRKHPDDANKITTFIKHTNPKKTYAGNKTVVSRKKGSHYYSPDNNEYTAKKKLGEAGPLVNRRHGSAYDRGSADKWYRRYDPHYYEGPTGDSPKIKITQKSHPKEWEEYHIGYDSHDDHKE